MTIKFTHAIGLCGLMNGFPSVCSVSPKSACSLPTTSHPLSLVDARDRHMWMKYDLMRNLCFHWNRVSEKTSEFIGGGYSS